MIELTIKAETPEKLRLHLLGLLHLYKGITLKKGEEEETCEPYHIAPVEVEEPNLVEVPKEERKPVITQAKMEENIANAPVHEEPKQPALEEVRATLKALRDKKGSGAVKELLKAYGADSLPDLKPEDYLGALSRAQMEVE